MGGCFRSHWTAIGLFLPPFLLANSCPGAIFPVTEHDGQAVQSGAHGFRNRSGDPRAEK